MVIERFPPLHRADKHGLLAVGGDLEVPSLLLAYRSGIFPWPIYENSLAWFSPPQRAILPFDTFHISKSLRRRLNKQDFRITFDTCFGEVIRTCATIHDKGDHRGTWISTDMIDAYLAFFTAGYAHSVEVWVGDALAGALYGVAIGGFFAAESMFHTINDGSKIALCALTAALLQQDCRWFDVQVLTPTTEHFGAFELRRADFIKLLNKALEAPVIHFKRGPADPDLLNNLLLSQSVR